MSSVDINRKTIYSILVNVETNSAYSNIEINNQVLLNHPDNPSFVREMVYGIIKNKYLLDFYISQFAKKVDKKDMILLRMGLYQLIFMNSVPDYAAISSIVELSKKVRYGKDKFINGVLRNLNRNLDNLPIPDSLDIKYSINKEIIELLKNDYTKEEIENILISSNFTPNISLRVNLRKTDKESLKLDLKREEIEVWDSDFSNRGLFAKGKNITETNAYKNGLFSIQDQSSIVCVDKFLSDYIGGKETIIDVCAAPGGKSLAIKEILSPESNLISCDIYDKKLKLLQEQALRLGLSNILTIKHDSTECLTEYIGKADRVLCDVPCSGLGVLRKKPEIKYKKDWNLADLIETQRQILKSSSLYVKDGGVLVYSTCTILEKENHNQVVEFLENNKNFVLEEEIKFIQNEEVDGFYIAKLRKVCK